MAAIKLMNYGGYRFTLRQALYEQLHKLIVRGSKHLGTRIDNESAMTVNHVIHMVGTLNTREIGGYPTTDGKRVVGGRIYRSANLSQISPSDIARLQSLGINAIIDFRGPKEAKDDPDRLPLGTEYVNSPIIGSSSGDDINDAKIMQLIQDAGLPETMLNQVEVTKHGPYYRMLYLVSSYGTHDHTAKLSGYRPFFQKLLRLPSSSNILIHCTGGRDRTGVGIALLLKTLGVLDEVIEADFVASNRYLQPDCDNPNSTRFLNYKSANARCSLPPPVFRPSLTEPIPVLNRLPSF